MATTRADGKDRDADQVSGVQALRRPELRDRLRADAAGLRAQAARAEATGQRLLDRMRSLAEQAGSVEELRRAPFEARVAADHHAPDRQAAQAADQRTIDHLRRQATTLAGTAETAGTSVAELLAEQQLRDTIPVDQKALELRLRASWRTEQREPDARTPPAATAPIATTPVAATRTLRRATPHRPAHRTRTSVIRHVAVCRQV